MNAPPPVEPSLRSAHLRAVEKANCWRGRCVNQFARGERVVSLALTLKAPGARLPLLLSQRLQKLTRELTESASVQAASAFAAHSELRNLIVHGDGKVFVDAKGGWMLRLECIGRSGPVQRCVGEEESEELYRRLQKSVQRLETSLRPYVANPGSSR